VLEEGSRNGEKVLDDGGAGRVEPAEKEEVVGMEPRRRAVRPG